MYMLYVYTMYMFTIPLITLSNFRKRKIRIAQHHMPNVIYACILSHACGKSERVCSIMMILTHIM